MKIDTTEAEVEIEKGCTKARYSLMNDGNNNTVDNGNNTDTSTIGNDVKVSDFDNKCHFDLHFTNQSPYFSENLDVLFLCLDNLFLLDDRYVRRLFS